MSRIGGKRICGKLSGVPFVNVERPKLLSDGSYKCASGYAPCIADMDPEKTICYKNEDSTSSESSCPITDVKFVKLDEARDHPDYTFLEDPKDRFDDNMVIGYSKKFEALPTTTLKIGQKPCRLPNQQTNENGDTFYPTEVMQGECKSVGDKSFYDERFLQESEIKVVKGALMADYNVD